MVSRRDYLHAVSAGALASLAGCTALPFASGGRQPTVLRSRVVHADSGWGSALAVGDGVLVVGAPAAFNRADNLAGAAFVFERAGGEWTKRARLRPPSDDFAGPSADVDGRLSFGSRVAVEDGVAVVASRDEPGVYWYERDGDGWEREGALHPGAATPGDSYVRATAFDGRSFVASTLSRREDADRVTETIHVYDARDDWPKAAELRRQYPASWDRYGYAVAVDGDTLAVASGVGGGDENPDSHESVVHVYRRVDDGWSLTTKFRPSPAYDHRGGRRRELALDGDTLVVGDLMTEDDGIPGRAHVYEYTGGDWERTAVLQPDGLAAYAHFGAPLALAGDALLVGAPQAAGADGVDGAAFLYERTSDGWTVSREYAADDAVREGRIGNAVALSGNWAALGGRVDREDRTDRNAVYVFPR